MESIKTVVTSKLFLRLVYIVAAYSTSHVVALVSSPKVSDFLLNAGVSFSINDPMKFKTAITAGMLFGGEFVYHWIHEKFIIPRVAPNVLQKEVKP